MDIIMLNQMQFYGFHGLFREENKLGQRFNVDAVLFLDLQKAGQTDDMRDTVDYGYVFKVIQAIVEGEAKYLVESVAQNIAETLLETFVVVQACTIKVTKPNPPIAGHHESVAVEIYRERQS